MPTHNDQLPDTYRLLAVFSGIPMLSAPALKLAGLWHQDDHAAITDRQRALLRLLTNDGQIRWINWSADGQGYVLTGIGEARLDIYLERYGPANSPRRFPPLASVLQARAAAAQDAAEDAE